MSFASSTALELLMGPLNYTMHIGYVLRNDMTSHMMSHMMSHVISRVISHTMSHMISHMRSHMMSHMISHMIIHVISNMISHMFGYILRRNVPLSLNLKSVVLQICSVDKIARLF